MLLIPILASVSLVVVAGVAGYLVGAIREANRLARTAEARAKDLYAEVIKETLRKGHSSRDYSDAD